MSRKCEYVFNPLLWGILVLVTMLSGCGSGSDGANGINGIDGVDGQDAALPLADIVALNPVLDLSNTISYNAASGAVTIHFFLTDGEGNGVDVTTDAYELRIYASELLPGDPTSGEGDAWNQLFNERGTPATGAMPGTLTQVDAATGEYTYVCSNTLSASSNVFRVTVTARWRETIDGVRYNFSNAVNASYDFLQSDPSNELSASGADMVATSACETCHGARIGNVGHGGGYTQVKTCNNCHNVNYMASRNGGEGDLAHMIHRIHNAGSFTVLHDAADFSDVTYPQHIYTCAKCHTADAPNADLAYTVPTARNCGSCHDTVNFVTGDNHGNVTAGFVGPLPDDSECTVCHDVTTGLGGGVQVVHDPVPDAKDVSEYQVAISMTAPANGEFYVAGETPVVTVTLADGSGPVAGTIYTADQDLVGTAGGGLSAANLYVYGPRADAVPVLTTNSSTDPALTGTPTQGHPLFVNELISGIPTANDDPLVTTDANGFSYQLMAIPADLAAGTYMVRFEGGDYGAVSDTDFVTSSTGLINFQVGTATEEHKVSGDACTNCHGETIMHLEGAHPHHVPFNTDQCLGCHDLSGNYGDYIGNRVHAVHSASVTGDLKNHDWSHVTFPQEPNNCTICHTNTEGTPVWRSPNEVVCGGCHGANPNAVPADYPTADPAEIMAEAAAAVHMQVMGGTFDVTTLGVTRQCIVCHGEDRIADLYDTHHLINFPPPAATDPNE
jgi:OmcA/MtrC family decaheme c-type cytochrome